MLQVKPVYLIPAQNWVVARFTVAIASDNISIGWDNWSNFVHIFPRVGTFIKNPVVMQISKKDCETTLILAAFIDIGYPRPVLEVSYQGESQLCSFPNVCYFDFAVATEHAMNIRYPAWLADNRITKSELSLQKQSKTDLLFTIVVPLYETPLNFLFDMVNSVKEQSYGKWELVLVNASPDNKTLCAEVDKLKKNESRIKVVLMDENEGIAGNTNAGIQVASGDFVGFMDHDDKIEPDLLYEYRKAIESDPEIDFLYCDEDLFDNDDRYFDPLFKPDFDIDLLRTHNYVTHLHMIRKSLLDTLDLTTSDMDGAQDYDITFKACEKARSIKHVSKVLYHWRAHALSTNIQPESKSYAEEAGRIAIQNHLDRVMPGASVEIWEIKNTYRVTYPLEGAPMVSFIIPNKDQSFLLRKCVAAIIEKAEYDNLEIIIVENNSTEAETFRLYQELQQQDDRIEIVTVEEPSFNYSKLINTGVAFSQGDYIITLNNDTQALTSGFVRELVSYAARSDVGIVGAKLLYPDETIQHAGVAVQFSDRSKEPAWHLFRELPRDNRGYHDRAVKTQDYSAVTGACQCFSKDLFVKVGGYNEDLAVAFNDIDFCLRVRSLGLQVVYNSFVEFYHFESISRGSDQDADQKRMRAIKEKNLLFDLWEETYGENGDPFYNRNFALLNPYCNLNYSRSFKQILLSIKRRIHRKLLALCG